MNFRIWLVVTGAFWLTMSAPVDGSNFNTTEAKKLYNLVQNSLSDLNGNTLDIREINEAYRAYPRSHAAEKATNDYVNLKYMLAHWREQIRERLIARIPGSKLADCHQTVRLLNELGIVLEERHLDILLAHLDSTESHKQNFDFLRDLFSLIANHGDRFVIQEKILDFHRATKHRQWMEKPTWHPLSTLSYIKALGPKDLRESPTYRKNFSWDWFHQRDLEGYEFVDAFTVRYRGQLFHSGNGRYTLALADLNHPAGGLKTCVTSTRSCFTDRASFVILEKYGKRVPAFLVFRGNQWHLVRLKDYLARHSLYYAELYVNKTEGEDAVFRDRIHQVLEDANERATEDDLIAHIFHPAGVSLGGMENSDTNHPGALRHSEKLGLAKSASYNANTILRSTEMAFYGVIDNGFFIENLARELVVGAPEVTGSLGELLVRSPGGQRKMLPFGPGGLRALTHYLRMGLLKIDPRRKVSTEPAFSVVAKKAATDAVAQVTFHCAQTLRDGLGTPFILQELENSPVVREAVQMKLEQSGLTRLLGH